MQITIVVFYKWTFSRMFWVRTAICAVDLVMKNIAQLGNNRTQTDIRNKADKSVKNVATCCASLSSGTPDISPSDAITTALVIGRPPGHHAGPNGWTIINKLTTFANCDPWSLICMECDSCVPSASFWSRPDMASNGFCLLNTVAVAAVSSCFMLSNMHSHKYSRISLSICVFSQAYARYTYGSLKRTSFPSTSTSTSKHYPKIAIVDIDIHHGNGTEEIVRNLRCATTCNQPP